MRRRRAIGSVLARLQREKKWLFIFKLVGPLIGTPLLGTAGFLNAPDQGTFPWKPMLGVAGAGFLLIGGVIVAFAERGGFEETQTAREAQKQAEEFLDERAVLEAQIGDANLLDQRRRHLLQAVQVMQEAVERVPLGPDIGSVLA